MQQGQAALARLLLQLGEALFLTFLELLLEGAAARRVLLTLERGREAGTQLLYQPFHVALQLLAHAGRQAQGARCGGLFEVVDVAPVVRGRLGRGALLHEALDDGVLARAAGP